MNWKTKEITTLIDVVRGSSDTNQFPGIFSLKLPTNCWSLDNKRILLDTKWRATNVILRSSLYIYFSNFNLETWVAFQRIICVDVESKAVTRLDNGIDKMSSNQVLKISKDWISAKIECYNIKPSLVNSKINF